MVKLIPARPSFAQDMSDTERSIMLRHLEYWKELMKKGIVIVFGPVMDPAGVYGMGIVELSSEEELQPILDADPATSINRYESYPMRAITAANV